MRLIGKRIARRLATDGPNADIMTPEWRSVILADPCVYCNERGPMQMEHITPRKYGGSNGWTNISPACPLHNTMKGEGPLWWLLWRLNERRLGFHRRRPIAFRNRVPVKWMSVYVRLSAQAVSRWWIQGTTRAGAID